MTRGTSMVFNRELSWLAFNQRVLDEACDPSVPLLERAGFLAITASNLDEFFMVRVGGLELVLQRRLRKRDASGMTPAQQIKAITQRARRMMAGQYRCLRETIEPALAAEGMVRRRPDDLSRGQLEYLTRRFEEEWFSVLTPMGFDPDGDPPLLAGLRMYVLMRLAPRGDAPARFAAIPLPRAMPRLASLPGEGRVYMLMEDVIARFADRFFPHDTVEECVPFRIARNADLIAREDFAATDFLEEMENVLARRKESDCVRLEVARAVSRASLGFLRGLLRIESRHIYRVPGPLDLTFLRELSGGPGFDRLRYEPWEPQPCPALRPGESMFDVLTDEGLLLFHPYESYEPVLRLIEEAAGDPDVLAIKQILYRTSSGSPIIAALQRAAEAGKAVTVIVELKARFDEARNIGWARELEHAGAQVIYGIRGYKTHAKLLIVVRRERRGIVRYLHIGTGNYNERTARLYSDVSYMTRDPDLAAEASSFFNAISGYSDPLPMRKLVAAPFSLRTRMIEWIDGEAERCRQGQKGLIMAKMNSLVDPAIVEALYRASQAGVVIRLNVRGICCLKPGVKGLSETIEVVSIVDRYLEHSRIFYFRQGGVERVYIGSADWMVRNLDRRIELLTPIEPKEHRRVLIEVLKLYFKDNVKGSRLGPDGLYSRSAPATRGKPLRSQEALYRRAVDAYRAVALTRRTLLQPHRPSPPDGA